MKAGFKCGRAHSCLLSSILLSKPPCIKANQSRCFIHQLSHSIQLKQRDHGRFNLWSISGGSEVCCCVDIGHSFIRYRRGCDEVGKEERTSITLFWDKWPDASWSQNASRTWCEDRGDETNRCGQAQGTIMPWTRCKAYVRSIWKPVI